jgi:hypothetical protein
LVATGEPRRLILVPTGSGTAQTVTTEDMSFEREARFAGPSRIWFRASRPGEVRAEYLKDIPGGTPRRIQSGSLFGWEAVSPDGRYVVMTSAKGGTVVRNLDVGEHGDRVVADVGVLGPCRVVGLGLGGETVYCQDQEAVVYRAELETGRREKLFTLFPEDRAGVLGVQSVVAADGRSVAYTVVRKESVLYTVDGVR